MNMLPTLNKNSNVLLYRYHKKQKTRKRNKKEKAIKRFFVLLKKLKRMDTALEAADQSLSVRISRVKYDYSWTHVSTHRTRPVNGHVLRFVLDTRV